MKSRIKEQGSALHIAIVVVLVVAVLGLLGFVLWQNFLNKPADVNSNSSTSTSETASDTSSTPKSLTISEWGVRGFYTADHRFYYKVNDEDTLLFKSDEFIACEQGIGTVSRYTADEGYVAGSTGNEVAAEKVYDSGVVKTQAHVGDYYYFYRQPTAPCSGDTIPDEERTLMIKSAKDFTTSLEITE